MHSQAKIMQDLLCKRKIYAFSILLQELKHMNRKSIFVIFVVALRDMCDMCDGMLLIDAVKDIYR
jgi:hypothetical protein